MSYRMPKINYSELLKTYGDVQLLLTPLIDVTRNGTLCVCPRYNVDSLSKLLHNNLLKLLYKGDFKNKYIVPYPTTWGMPHVERIDYMDNNYTKEVAYFIVQSSIFE